MTRLLAWLQKPIDLLLWIALAAGLLMMLHVTIDVAGRTLFNHPFEGTTEIVSAYYMVVAAYLPGPGSRATTGISASTCSRCA